MHIYTYIARAHRKVCQCCLLLELQKKNTVDNQFESSCCLHAKHANKKFGCNVELTNSRVLDAVT